jgi:hypothetical protein
VPLHFVHSNGDGILQREVLRVLGQDGLKQAWNDVSDVLHTGGQTRAIAAPWRV